FINDLFNLLECRTVSFADDTSVICRGASVESLISSANQQLSLAYEWFTVNRLTFNASKTKFVLFKPPQVAVHIPVSSIGVNGVCLSEVDSIRCLGVNLSGNLSWSSHINHVSSRLSYVLATLYKLRISNVPESVLVA